MVWIIVLPPDQPPPRLRRSAEALRAKAEGGSHASEPVASGFSRKMFPWLPASAGSVSERQVQSDSGGARKRRMRVNIFNLRDYGSAVTAIADLEGELRDLSKHEIERRSRALHARARAGEDVGALRSEMFALAREAARRSSASGRSTSRSSPPWPSTTDMSSRCRPARGRRWRR